MSAEVLRGFDMQEGQCNESLTTLNCLAGGEMEAKQLEVSAIDN